MVCSNGCNSGCRSGCNSQIAFERIGTMAVLLQRASANESSKRSPCVSWNSFLSHQTLTPCSEQYGVSKGK